MISITRPARHSRGAVQAGQRIVKDGGSFARHGFVNRYGAPHRACAAFHERRIADQDECRYACLLSRKPGVDGNVRPDAGGLAERQDQGKRGQGKRRVICRWLRRAHLYSMIACDRKLRRYTRAIRAPRSLVSLVRAAPAAMV